MLTILIIILLILAIGGGGWGHGVYGPGAWSPLGLILIIFLVLFLTGYLR